MRRVLWMPLALVLLSACQSAPPRPVQAGAEAAWPELRAEYQAQASQATVYAVDAAASQVRIYVFRAGTAARLGHNHVLSAPTFEGYVALPSAAAADARFELRVPLAALVVDDPALREQTGGNFAGARSEGDIAGTRANMLGPRGFEAERYPLVRLRSLRIDGDWPELLAQVEVTLHGVTRSEPVPLQVTRTDAGLAISGSLLLRQSDYGVTPLSVLGGLIQVQDPVMIRFQLSARPLSPR